MAHGMESPAGNTVLQAHPSLTFHKGVYTWTVQRRGADYIYSVTDGAGSLALPIHWAFGANAQTWVLEYDGRLYESYVSYYPGVGLEITMGDQRLEPGSLPEAMGRLLSPTETRICFGCHATAAVAADEVQFAKLTPGVQCQRCHANADAHFAAITHGSLDNVPPKLSRMSTEQTSSFCGQCHRSFADVLRTRLFGPVDVRFQPYRLSLSRCYNGSDARISCVACHNPHVEVVKNDAAYDGKCMACHTGSRSMRSCPVAKAGCVTCHMPKTDLPGAHAAFTDHFIRIVRPGDVYPDSPQAQ